METYYETLNLGPSASIQDIKAAYRRLAKQFHPDSAGTHGGDVSRFVKVHEAYRHLINELEEKKQPGGAGFNKSYLYRRYASSKNYKSTGRDRKWRFEGVADEGNNVVYVIKVSADAAETGLKIVMPWNAEQACPKCLGQGHTLKSISKGPILRQTACDKCHSTGVIKQNSTVHVDLTPEIIRQGRVRIKGLGHYRPKEAARGDLIIEISVKPAAGNRQDGMYAA